MVEEQHMFMYNISLINWKLKLH